MPDNEHGRDDRHTQNNMVVIWTMQHVMSTVRALTPKPPQKCYSDAQVDGYISRNDRKWIPNIVITITLHTPYVVIL